MPHEKPTEKELQEFEKVFSGLNPQSRQTAMATLLSLQFAEEEERNKNANEQSASHNEHGGGSNGGDDSCQK